jgi:hypothetical protein
LYEQVFFNLLEKKIAFFTVSVVLVVMLSSACVAYPLPVNIYPPGSSPYGISYKDNIKNYWRHIISIPADQSPMKDKTGEKCAVGQENSSSPVFYLAGTGGGKAERTCTIPYGKGVLIPVMNVEISDKEVPNKPVEDLHKFATQDQDSVTSLYLRVNDKEYDFEYLKSYRIHTDAFDVVFPENPIFGVTPGKSKAVADGYYIMTDVLPKGKHEIHFKSSLRCPEVDCPEPTFAQDVKYTLMVK